MKKISLIFGTRPEAIKMAPLIILLKDTPNVICHICVTAQHRQMLDQVLDIFEITPDLDLDLMVPNQTLAGLTSSAITKIDQYFAIEKPDLVLIQGDTTTVLSAAISAFYNKIPIGHVEAGLRTGNLQSPWPEEANRVLTTRLATWHFAPTDLNRQNLLKEGVSDDKIYVTGNTVIDALFIALNKLKDSEVKIKGLPNNSLDFLGESKMILVTGHRRENFGDGFDNICYAISELAERFPDVHFIYPVHLNPRVVEPVNRILNKKNRSNIHLIDPQGYLQFVALMNRAHIILTDSGGVQEEAPSLGKAVLVMRNTTERSEAVTAGTVKLVGTDKDRIIEQTSLLLTDSDHYSQMTNSYNPYGEGNSAKLIVDILVNDA